jgi:hypothetical protein
VRTDRRPPDRAQRAPVPTAGPHKWATTSSKIPKLRAGSFFPNLLEPRRRIDQALYAVIAQAYVEGISTRSVDDLVLSADMVAAALHTVFVHSDPQGLSAARAPSGTH